MPSTKLVTVSTTTVGQSFGTRGVICDAATGQEIDADLPIRPFGNEITTERDAEYEVIARGWTFAD